MRVCDMPQRPRRVGWITRYYGWTILIVAAVVFFSWSTFLTFYRQHVAPSQPPRADDAPREIPHPAPLPLPSQPPRRADDAAPTASPTLPAPTGPTVRNANDAGPFVPAAHPASPLDQALNRLVSGNIAFNVPDHIPLGKSQIIQAKLSTKLPKDLLLKQLSEAGAKESAGLKVADKMAATLTGGGAFDVSPSGPQEQLISDEEVTSWTWIITPKQQGTQILILSFDAVLMVDGTPGKRNINTFTRKIEIDVPWPQTPSEWFVLVKQWFENISWLWVTILVPFGALVVWAWNKLRKKPLQGLTPDAAAKDEASSWLD
jgi:hypothetical protein